MRPWIWAVLTSLAACGGVVREAAGPPPPPPPPRPQTLVVVSEQPRRDAEPQALGLSGSNKPNGTQYRYRVSVPPAAPAYVLRALGPLALTIADSTRDGWLAFYRTPPQPEWRNSQFRAVLFAFDGSPHWSLDLSRLLARDTQLEIQDIRYGASGELYLNEACQTYARDAANTCSALLRVDPRAARVVWRSRPLVSNNILLPYGQVVIAGYGFTAEPDALHLVDAGSGVVLATLPLDSAHQYLEWQDGLLYVLTVNRVYRVRVQ